MRKTYAAPAVVAVGDAVEETKGVGGPAPDVGGLTKRISSGSVGFNL
jgi:hypothetical protein